MTKTLGELLLSAVRHRRTQEALELIKKGADVNVVSFCKETPLLLAIETLNNELIRALVENGADVDYVQHFPADPEEIYSTGGVFGHEIHKCPLSAALEKNNFYGGLEEEIKLLKSHGAKDIDDLIK